MKEEVGQNIYPYVFCSLMLLFCRALVYCFLFISFYSFKMKHLAHCLCQVSVNERLELSFKIAHRGLNISLGHCALIFIGNESCLGAIDKHSDI